MEYLPWTVENMIAKLYVKKLMNYKVKVLIDFNWPSLPVFEYFSESFKLPLITHKRLGFIFLI